MAEDAAAIKERSDESKREGFDRFMSAPMTRLVISAIPAGEQADALQMLLRAAYDAGFGSGESYMLCEVATRMLTRKRDER